VPLPNSHSAPTAESSLIAGSVLPIQRAEELLATLPGVMSARIVASPNGAVDEIHILTTTEFTPKQTVRNVESALIAHLGMHVSHKKISVATSDEGQKNSRIGVNGVSGNSIGGNGSNGGNGANGATALPLKAPAVASAILSHAPRTIPQPSTDALAALNRRRIYFEDVEVRRSRTRGVTCRVTLRKGDQSYIGEAEGIENERLRIELAARASLSAIKLAEGDERVLGLEGCRVLEAFDRNFVFVGVSTKHGRDTALMTGSAEVRESPETASVLAVLDATNRWLDR
jgi:hypothetical protein